MAIGIGETLRAARREQGLSLSDVAETTRIRESYLHALEQEEFEALGEDVYVRGFLRNYAQCLGLAPEPLLSEYRTRFQHQPAEASVAVTPAVRQPVRVPVAVRVVGAVGLLVLLLAVVAIAGDLASDTTAPRTPPLAATPSPTEAEAAPTTAPTARRTASPTPTADLEPPPEPEREGVELSLEVAGGPAWVRVVVDGTTALEQTLEDGARHDFEGQEEISLRLGNASFVRLTVDGDDLGPAGGPGEVVDLSFTSAREEGAPAD